MSAPQNDGEPAFPVSVYEREFWDREENGSPNGMSLRDYFAAAAIHGATEWSRKKGKESIHDDGYNDPHHQPCLPELSEDDDCKEIAKACYAIADAMLAARKEGA
jgi:hypothetical protein